MPNGGSTREVDDNNQQKTNVGCNFVFLIFRFAPYIPQALAREVFYLHIIINEFLNAIGCRTAIQICLWYGSPGSWADVNLAELAHISNGTDAIQKCMTSSRTRTDAKIFKNVPFSVTTIWGFTTTLNSWFSHLLSAAASFYPPTKPTFSAQLSCNSFVSYTYI